MKSIKLPELKGILRATSVYDFGEKYLRVRFNWIAKTLLMLLSPTWFYASFAKRNLTPIERRKGIIGRNYSYLFASLFFCVILSLFYIENTLSHLTLCYKTLLVIFLYGVTWSRCNEILFAFIKDAMDKASLKPNSSSISAEERIRLALLSYIELIINYAVIFLFMPKEWFTNSGIESMLNAVYFSGVTITTLGYGDISPVHWLPKLLVLHEVLAGFTLIIVSFALYVGNTSPNESNESNESKKSA